MSKIYVFDLDGTLCEERKTFEKSLANANKYIIGKVNSLYDDDNTIIIYTARSWSEFKMTEYWLKENNVKYHILMCGKVIYDYWIDDRAINVNDFGE